MKHRAVVASLPLLLMAGSMAQSVEPANCLAYEPTEVSLTGRLVTRYFPGPPSYGETPSQDSSERVYLLQLQVPICVDADATSELNSKAETGIVEVQLWPSDDVTWSQLLALEGSQVVLSGTLSHAITAHHRRAVLLAVLRFQRLAA